MIEVKNAGDPRAAARVNFELHSDVIASFPTTLVTGFLAKDIQRAVANLADTSSLGQDASKTLDAAGLTPSNLLGNPVIAGWREAIRACGLKASSVRSSPEQLVRRVLRGEVFSTPLPLVNVYCDISAKWLAPLGGYDLDSLSQSDVSVRKARPETDRFSPLGGSSETMPLSPEVVVYACGDEVLCWAFNHRDSSRTCLRADTNVAAFFSEAALPVQAAAMAAAIEELRALLLRLGATVSEVRVAGPDSPWFAITL